MTAARGDALTERRGVGLIAFGLSTAESMGIELWSISWNVGDSLSIVVADNNPEAARALAFGLGVDTTDHVEHRSKTTYSISSRAPAPAYHTGPYPYPYSGASVPFGDRLVGISVVSGLPEEERGH
jgi:hypothetical protein